MELPNNSNAPIIPRPLDKDQTIKRILKGSRHTLLLSMHTAAFEKKKEEGRNMAEKLIAEKQAKRYRVLHRIYEESKCNTLEKVPETLIAEKEGLTKEELQDILLYLIGEGLIKFVTMGHVAIVHKGIKEIEDSITNPNRGTEHFQPTIIQHFHGTAIGVQAGTQNSTQSISISINAQFDQAITQLRIAIEKSAEIDEFQKEDAIDAINKLQQRQN